MRRLLRECVMDFSAVQVAEAIYMHGRERTIEWIRLMDKKLTEEEMRASYGDDHPLLRGRDRA